MVASDLVALAALQRRALNHVHARPIMALHVEINRRKTLRAAVAEIARDRQRLEEHLRHDDGAAKVQHCATIVNREQRMGEPAKIAMARVADGSAITRRMLM